MTDNSESKRPMRPVYTDSPSRDFLDSFLKDNDKTEDADEATPETTSSTSASTLGTMSNTDAITAMREKIVEKIQTIYDPEIPVNLYDLGLIYEILVDDENNVDINMTLTTPHCPVAESMPGEVQTQVMAVEGVGKVSVALVWEPPWDMSRMSEEARLELGFI